MHKPRDDKGTEEGEGARLGTKGECRGEVGGRLPSCLFTLAACERMSPVNTSTRQLAQQAKRDGLNVLKLFGGIGLRVLRTALAGGCSIRCYTYVDQDTTSRRIAKPFLQNLQQPYPNQLPNVAIRAFDKHLPCPFPFPVYFPWQQSTSSQLGRTQRASRLAGRKLGMPKC